MQRDYFNVNFVKSLIFDPAQLPIVSCAILVTELVLNVLIVQRVNYTEIDWIAYMQQCEGFLNGTTNYALLKGTPADRSYANITSYLPFISVFTNSRLFCTGIYFFRLVLNR